MQANWAPIVIPGSLLIRFPWHPPAAEIAAERGVSPSLPALTLQPGMAFGTGEHPTTQLCCEAVRAALERPELRGNPNPHPTLTLTLTLTLTCSTRKAEEAFTRKHTP